MKVAIIHDFLIKNGGAEKVLEAFHKLYPKAPIYTLLYDKIGTKGVFEGSDYSICTSSLQKYPRFIRNRSKLLLTKFPKTIEEFDLSQYDLVISSSNSFAHGVITKPDTLHICYCHSPIRYLWDWHHEYLSENDIGFNLTGILIRKILNQIRLWDYYSSCRPDIWIANSKNVQKRILKYYRQKSDIIYPASDVLFDKPSRTNNDYYLILSRLSPYKKVDLAVQAFNKNRKKLIIVGEGSEHKRLKQIAQGNIQFTGYATTQEVKKRLQDCKALIFPGEEDFGLTPIEAMSAGKPVIAFNKGGVIESVIEGKTGVFFNRPTPDSLNEAIDKLENNYDSFTAEACHQRAEEFSITSFSNKISSFIEENFKKFTNDK